MFCNKQYHGMGHRLMLDNYDRQNGGNVRDQSSQRPLYEYCIRKSFQERNPLGEKPSVSKSTDSDDSSSLPITRQCAQVKSAVLSNKADKMQLRYLHLADELDKLNSPLASVFSNNLKTAAQNYQRLLNNPTAKLPSKSLYPKSSRDQPNPFIENKCPTYENDILASDETIRAKCPPLPSVYEFKNTAGHTHAGNTIVRDSSNESKIVPSIVNRCKIYPYDILKVSNKRLPIDVHRCALQKHLSAEEFELVMQMPRAKFNQLPKWKQIVIKKQVDLF